MCGILITSQHAALLLILFSRLKKKLALSAFPHSPLLKILSCVYVSEMSDKKVLSTGLQDTNPGKGQI